MTQESRLPWWQNETRAAAGLANFCLHKWWATQVKLTCCECGSANEFRISFNSALKHIAKNERAHGKPRTPYHPPN